jgi:hypothetical protein
MACLGEITCDSDIGGSPFIIAKKGTITSAEEEIKSLGSQIGDAITQIESEISSGGLDEYSLYVNGSSPAYDEAMKIIEDLNQIKEDLSKLAESYEQNYLEHYSKELDKYIEKVKEKIEELKGQLAAKEEELAAKEETYKDTKNDTDRASYKADIDALKGEIEELKEEIQKYEKKLEEAEQAKAGIDAQVEKIVAAKIAEQEARQAETATTDTTDETTGSTSSSTSRSSGTSGGGSGNYGGSSGYVSGGSTGESTGGTTPGSTATTQTEEIKDEDKPKEVGFEVVDKDKLDKKSKKIFEDKDFKYKDGYAMIGDRYVIACDSSLAKVGDILRFTQKDGTVIECIVGIVTTDAALKNKISFIVEDKGKFKEKAELKDILKNNKKIEKITKTGGAGEIVNVSGTNVTNGNIIDTSTPVGEGTKYNLSDDDLAHLAYVALREQGSVEGAKLELSLMANLYEKNASRYSSVRDYVENSGWFASGSRTGYSYPGDAYVQVAREVLNEGKRYLPSNVVEHDCISDLTSSSTGSVSDRSSYIPGQTVLANRYGSRYMFVGFAPNGGDPFGYLV